MCRVSKMKWFLSIVLFSFISYVSTFSQFCSDGEKCMHYEQCPLDIQDMVAMGNRPPHVTRQLMKSRCDRPQLRKLCCKPPPPSPPQPECYTWDGRPGECVESKTKYHKTKFQADMSRCSKRDFICHSDTPVLEGSGCEVSAFPSDPSYGCCGKDYSAPECMTFYDGSKVILGEYPSLAVLKYEADKRNCSGVLISGKYVLTAASCVNHLLPLPYAVVFGEHDKSTKFDSNENGECAYNNELTIGIEEIITHEGFNVSNPRSEDDIALIRLMKMATYSDFIQPICLPVLPLNVAENFRLWSVGWGYKNMVLNSSSDIKRKVQVPLVDPLTCKESYPSFNPIHQICVGGEPNQSPCIIDYGSPLIRQASWNMMEVVGITSYHDGDMCNGSPAVYTEVYSYLSWIHSHIRP